MPTATRTFRVFVSSTFEDLKAERDALQRDVFPSLRKLCEKNNARFQAIDLRWGVRDEAALDQQTMEICLREIERCQQTGIKPNFIVLLGERYGWRPLPARIEAGEFKKVCIRVTDAGKQLINDWYERDDNAVLPEFLLKPRTGEFADKDRWGEVEQQLHRILREAARDTGLASEALIKYEASATHQEILKGLGESEEERRHVFAFFREAAKGAREDAELAALKNELSHKLPERNIRPFQIGEIEKLCTDIEESLTKVILDETSRFTSRDALEVEIEAHNLFAQERSKVFYGRKNALDAIEKYIRGPERRALVLHGASGSGKSALMAKATEQYTGPGRVIRRFIGASPESASGHALLTSLCKQIAPGETPVDYAQLEKAFQERLATATAEQPLVLFIDALDQLSASDPARGATWLPAELPAHVKVIVSTTDDVERLPQGLPVPLERMTLPEGGQALDELLRGTDSREQRRTLQPWQRDLVLDQFERCGLPLYLKLAAEESRLWKSFSSPGACRLGEGIAGVLDTLFGRLASNVNHGPVLVERSLGYLAAARYGLTEDEMLDVLTADDVVWDDFDMRKHHEVSERRLPVVAWSRLSLDLEAYLTERAAPGGTVIAFYHRQLAERVDAKFLAGDEAQKRHSDLARYFSRKPAWLDESCRIPNARRAAELSFQQRGAQEWSEAEATLFDSPFLFAKVAAGMILDLDDDYRALFKDAPESELPRRNNLRLIQGALRLSLHVVAVDGGQFASQMRARLLAHQAQPGITALLTDFDACAPRPRLRPHWPALQQAGGSALRVLEGHKGSVNAVVLTANGNCAVSGSEDHTLRVWNIEENLPPRVMQGSWSWVWAVALTIDGKHVVFSDSDNKVRVWDVDGNGPLRVLEGHTGWVWAVAISTDGRRVVSASDDKTLRVWDIEGIQPTRILKGHTDSVCAVALSADGTRVISGSRDHTLRVWNLNGTEPPRILEGHTGWVNAVALTGDGKRAISGSGDKTLRVWDMEGNQPPRILEGHTDSVKSVALSGDGKHAVSGSSDKTLRTWDLDGNQSPRILEGHTDVVNAVALTGDGKRAISGSGDKTLRVWDLDSSQRPCVPRGHTNSVLAVALTADGQRAISASEDKTLRVWDLNRNLPSRILEGHTDSVKAVALKPDGKYAISGSRDETLRVWDLDSNRPPRVLECRFDSVNCVALAADGKCAVSGSDSDASLRVRDLEGNGPPKVLGGHTGWVLAVALTSDGKRAISGSHDKTLRYWDLEKGYALRVLQGHPGDVCAVAVTGDGRRAISGSDNTLRVWDLCDNRPPRVLEGHTLSIRTKKGREELTKVRAVALSGDGQRAVSGSEDKTLRVWDLESGKCLAVFTCDAEVLSCAWARERELIVAGDESGQVHLFAWEE